MADDRGPRIVDEGPVEDAVSPLDPSRAAIQRPVAQGDALGEGIHSSGVAVPLAAEVEVEEGVNRFAMVRGSDWSNESNRFAELESATAVVEAERDALKAELLQRRQQQLDHTLSGGARPATVAGDGTIQKELEDLRCKLAEANKLAADNLATAADERERSAKISEELRRRVADLSRLSSEKWQADHDSQSQKVALQSTQEERDRLLHEKGEAERKTHEATNELSKIAQDLDAMRRAKETLRLELERELEDVKNEAQFHRTVAVEARSMQEKLRHRNQEANEKLREQAKAAASEYAALEQRFALQSEHLRRETELRESVQKQLAEVAHERDEHESSALAASGDSKRLRESIAELEQQLAQKTAQHEELLRTHIPGAAATFADGPPEGFASLAELVAEATTSREELLKERRAKEELQGVLREVEREVRARYPALLGQREEAERLRCVCGQLTQQNESLLASVRELEDGKKAVTIKKRQAQRSVQILEEHAKDLAKQLAVVVHENRKLTGALPLLGTTESSDVEQLEAERTCFRTLEGLTAQNEQLRKAVPRLTDGCETKAQQELQELKEEQEQQLEVWEKHLAEKAEQMKALAETVERLTRERDDAQNALVAAEQRRTAAVVQSEAGGDVSAAAPQLKDASGLGEQIAASVRKELSKSLDGLREETKEARASEVKLRQKLLTCQAECDLEKKRKTDFEERLRQVQKELDDARAQRTNLDRKYDNLEDVLRQERLVSQDLQTSLGRARQEVQDLNVLLETERLKRRALEQTGAAAASENANLTQTIVDLKARATQTSKTHAEARRDLETAFRREERLLRDQLELQIGRQRDLRSQIEELNADRVARDTEAKEACARIAELEIVNARLDAKLAERIPLASQEPRIGIGDAAVNTQLRPNSASVVEEAEAQLLRSAEPRDEEPEVAKLEQKLQSAENREKELVKNAEVWKSLIADYEVQLGARQAKMEEVESALVAAQTQLSKHDEEVDKVRQREQKLETQTQLLNSEIAELQASLAKKKDEVEAAELAGTEKIREVENKVAALELQRERDRDGTEELRQRYRDEASAHSKDMKELDDSRAKQAVLEQELEKLRSQARDSADNVTRAREEFADQTETLRLELQRAREHSDVLAIECERYREHLATMSDQLRQQEDAPEAVQRVALEMRKASEAGEKERRELEVDRNRLENEAKALREEAADLQRRLDGEQQKVLRLQAEIRREQRAVGKLGQLGMLEDENRRLLAASKSLEERLDETQKELEARKAQQEPLEQKVSEQQKKEEDSERAKKVLETKTEEFKRLHDEMVLKFDAYDLQHSAKQQAEMREMRSQIEKANEELRQKSVEAEQNMILKTRCNEATTKTEQLQKQIQELHKTIKDKDIEVQRARDLHKLGARRVDELEKEKREGPAANVALQKKAEDERNAAQEKADKALGLAMDYQRALETLLNQRRHEQQKQDQHKQQQQAEKAKALAIPRSATPAPVTTTIGSADASSAAAGATPQAPAAQASTFTFRKEAAEFVPGVVGGHQLTPAANATSGAPGISMGTAQPTTASGSSGSGTGGGALAPSASTPAPLVAPQQVPASQDVPSAATAGAKRKDLPSTSVTTSAGGSDVSTAAPPMDVTNATAVAEHPSCERAAKAARVATGAARDAIGGNREADLPVATATANPTTVASGASAASTASPPIVARGDSIIIEDDEAEAARQGTAPESSK